MAQQLEFHLRVCNDCRTRTSSQMANKCFYRRRHNVQRLPRTIQATTNNLPLIRFMGAFLLVSPLWLVSVFVRFRETVWVLICVSA